MNREIKFRAWDKDENIMRDWKNLMDIVYGDNKINGSDINDCIFNDDDLILMQFTGLHDSKGREIWEGDIISAEGLCNLEVIWDSYGWAVKWNNCEYTEIDFIDDELLMEEIEVIGDIYTTPELLEGK